MFPTRAAAGFTLIEVLIALAITAFVSVIAYSSFSTVITGVRTRKQLLREFTVSTGRG